MSKTKKKFYKAMFNRTLIVLGVFSYGYFLSSGVISYKNNSVSNINGVKSLEAVHMINKYSPKDEKLQVMAVNNMKEAATYGPTTPISFTGQMTAYKATCPGCTGRVSCPPRQDVRNNNIWYNDNVYGKIRIMAADPNIPCGTVVKITNVTFTNEEIIGIVLDRGGAIKGNIMDFLVGENDNMDIVGRQRNVNYEVVRWGW